jgi:hypothetical protein
LARLLIRHGVSFGQASELLKVAMVNEAIKSPRPAEKNDYAFKAITPTDSWISVATGVHRKDVKRIREEADPLTRPMLGSLASQVIAKWLSMGNPPPPLIRKSSGASDSFDELVSDLSTDMRPKAILDSFIARGVVSETDGLLTLHTDRLVLNQEQADLLNYLGMNVHDHLSVAVDNTMNQGEPQLERCVYFHGISASLAEELHRLSKHEGMRTLQIVNETAQRAIANPDNRGEYRINLGVYFRQERSRER